ncbi:alkaline phosphatase [Candidatus Vecturithrix granuli]|uniref:Alkaline phosphatase n=1 Tax=Vecturithrix granuli TaxID=1499967 RepID=A0A081C1L3_VECG1|nr:alkaline phosphatase [Candidatus Vecturithrix granuli]
MRFSKMLSLVCVVVLVSALLSPVCAAQTPKYVFLFIGDGTGIPQRMATELIVKGEGGEGLLLNRLPAYGVTTTRSFNSLITDSSSAGTAIATGFKTVDGYVGVDPEFKPLETIAEMAKKKGMKVGILTSVSMDHATPASFYAHQESRNMFYEIALDMAKSGFDYFGGGALLDPDGKKSKNPGKNAYDIIKEAGYSIFVGREEFGKITKEAGKVYAYNDRLDSSMALPYSIDMKPEDITLAEFTQKGIDLLADHPQGFFMMIEGGKVDWTCHANDAATAVKEVMALDEAVKVAYTFYEAHPEDTLIVVTGDHETGGLTIGFAGTQYDSYFDLLKPQKISYDDFTKTVLKEYKETHAGKANFDDMIPLMKEYFGLEMEGEGRLVLKDFELQELKEAFVQSMSGVKVNVGTIDYLLYGSYDPFTVALTHILNQKAGLGWTTFSHTGLPVGTSAVGVQCEQFNGFYDNTDIAKKFISIMGLEPTKVASIN